MLGNTTNSTTEEILDLVDENDKITGTIRYADVHDASSLKGSYIRASSCFILNSEEKLWIPRRTATKKIAPNGLDYSAGGHVQTGETYDQAMLRELEEETGIHADPSELICIGKLTPKEAPPHYYFSSLYVYHSNRVPNFIPEDFVGFKLLSCDELYSRLQDGEPAKQSLLPSVDILRTYLAQ